MTDGVTIANGAPRTLGTVQSYDDLHQLMRARADELNISRLDLDRGASLCSGHVSKILSPQKIKSASWETLSFLLPALGAALVLVEDLESLEQIRKRFPERHASAIRNGAVHFVFSRRHMRKIARKGGANSRKNMSPRQRRALARKAAMARWHAPKITGEGS